jgi:Antitoxin VbhA
MDTRTKRRSRTTAQEEQRLLTEAVRAGIASARIEDGVVGPEAPAIMNEWARGLIDEKTAVARIDTLHAT